MTDIKIRKPIYDPKKDPFKVVTGTIRGSYINVFKPRPNMQDASKMEYSMMLLIPKADEATVGALKKAIKAAKEKKFGTTKVRGLKMPMKDADNPEHGYVPEEGEDDPTVIEQYEKVYKGNYIMNVRTTRKPSVVRPEDPTVEIDSEKEFKSGDYCRVSIRSFGYEAKNEDGKAISKGISFGLNHVQKLETGEALGFVSNATDDFGAVDDVADVPGEEADAGEEDDDLEF